MAGSRRGSALLNELSRAEAKIGTLEEFIREREGQLHVAVSRLRSRSDPRRTSRSHGGGTRRRRAGITDSLLRMRASSRDSFDRQEDGKLCLPQIIKIHSVVLSIRSVHSTTPRLCVSTSDSC